MGTELCPWCVPSIAIVTWARHQGGPSNEKARPSWALPCAKRLCYNIQNLLSQLDLTSFNIWQNSPSEASLTQILP